MKVTGAGGEVSFASTGLYQEAEFPTGRPFPFMRTGIHVPGLSGNDPNAYLGGGEAVVKAGVVCTRQLLEGGHEVEIVVSAGRPDYLDKAGAPPGLSEGSVMEQELREELGDTVPITVFSDNRVTKDDGKNMFTVAKDPHCDVVLVIALASRMSRIELILLELTQDDPDLKELLPKIRIVPVEMFISNVSRFLEMTLSDAYARTVANERFGMEEALATGKTATTGGKT